MFDMLTNKWGMGPRLAQRCLGAYGGHVWQTAIAIRRLALRKEDFAAEDGVVTHGYAGILSCVSQGEKCSRIIDALKNLAATGFSPLRDAFDPVAQVLSNHNVGGVVSKSGVVVGMRSEDWGGFEYGLVPTSQQTRLMIAKVLEREGLWC